MILKLWKKQKPGVHEKVREYNQAQTGEHDVPGTGADKGENG